jgi:putative peptidoglycan lipid II flippase
VIAGLTVLTRFAGFLRTLVFAGAVGTTDLGDTYQTANTIPNLIFEVVAGGALAVVVVPLLAGAVADGDRRRVAETTSALLTWTTLLLVPLAALLALLARPVVALLAGDASPEALAVGERMLRVFAVQLPLYGIGVVLTGVLHAHHRFTWPVLAPLLSSATVIGAYAAFAAVEGPGTRAAEIGRAGELILSVGTTAGVVVLTLCLLIPLRSLRLGLRPNLTLDPGLRRRAVGLAGAAVVTVAAQQLATGYLIRLANDGPDGSLVLFLLAQTVFLLPWAVFAVPLSTPTFPVLAEAAATGATERFNATLARTARAVAFTAALGVAGLLALAYPLAHLLSAATATRPAPAPLAAAIVAFAPGLAGFALFALLSRALVAAGAARAAAVAAVAGWAATAATALTLATVTAVGDRVAALAAATSVGTTVLGVAGTAAVVRTRGPAALAGLARTLLIGAGATIFSALPGWMVGRAVTGPDPTVGAALLGGLAAGTVVVAAFAVVGAVADRDQIRPALRLVVRRWGGGG